MKMYVKTMNNIKLWNFFLEKNFEVRKEWRNPEFVTVSDFSV